jgi:arginyl-tRNA synthetase
MVSQVRLFNIPTPGICSVLRKAAERSISAEGHAGIQLLDPVERSLIMQLHEYPSIIRESADKFEPSTLANYLYQLAKAYNHFYATLPILNAVEEQQCKFRLQLSSAIASIIKKRHETAGN